MSRLSSFFPWKFGKKVADINQNYYIKQIRSSLWCQWRVGTIFRPIFLYIVPKLTKKMSEETSLDPFSSFYRRKPINISVFCDRSQTLKDKWTKSTSSILSSKNDFVFQLLPVYKTLIFFEKKIRKTGFLDYFAVITWHKTSTLYLKLSN